MRAGEVSEVSQDYLKVIWSAQEWGGQPATATELADRFGTTKANVTEVLKRLDELGLITRVPYKPPVLTEEGEALAVAMVRRHRLIETFLVESLGYGWDEVHDEAESLEHAASDLLIDRIDGFLGRPRSDPHGDPIPQADGSVDSHTPTLLAEAGPGHYQVLRVSDADPVVLGQLAEVGVLPDVTLDVLGGDRGRAEKSAGGQITVSIGERRETIAAALASAVYLRAETATSAGRPARAGS